MEPSYAPYYDPDLVELVYLLDMLVWAIDPWRYSFVYVLATTTN